MPTSPSPVVFIGLDGAEPALIQQGIAQGVMPCLAALARHGSFCAARTLPGMGDGALWPSLITGTNPGRHGRYFRIQNAPHSYRRRQFDVDTDLATEPFWQALSRAGRRVAVVDVPFAPAVRDFNGVLLTDWLMHDRYGPPRSWPEAFAGQVLAEYGDDPLGGNSDRVPDNAASNLWLLQQCIERIRRKARLVSSLLRRERWDLMATAFAEPHDIGHRLWHMHDPEHPLHDPEWRAANGDPMARLIVELDAAIGRIVGAASAEATIVLFMGLGMGPNYTANKVLGTVLRRLDGRAAPTCLTLRARRAGAPPGALRITGRLDEMFRQRADARSRYFQVPHNANAGAVRINLAGREPAGTVKPADFEGVCEQLERSLRRLVHPRNGRPIVADVVRVAAHCQGPRVAELPDLLVQWNREQPFDAVASAEVGTIHGARPWGRTGDHTPNAAFMIGGAGATGMDIERNLSVLDVAPTIAAMLDVSLPGIDGRSALLRSRTPVIDP